MAPNQFMIMARPKKYPDFPGPGEKEVPYDTVHFKMWCVDEEGMPEQTAKVYVSRIRSAFEHVFNSEYTIFELLAQAFRGYLRQPEICLKNLETVSNYLKDLIDLMAQLPAEEFFEDKKLNYKPKTLKEWVSAFYAYHRYYEWRIDKLRLELGRPSEIAASKKDWRLPLKKEFSEYLRKECHYAPTAVWSYVTFLTKLKNLFFCFIFEELDRDIFDLLTDEDNDWESISSLLKDMEELTDMEIENIEENIPSKIPVVMSVDELKRGKKVLGIYRDFLKYRFKQSSLKNNI